MGGQEKSTRESGSLRGGERRVLHSRPAVSPPLQYRELGNYSDSTESPTVENHLCSTVEGPLLTSFKAVFMPVAYGFIFLLGMMGNILVLVILERHRHTRSSTETFLFHLAVADLLLVFILPFAVVEGSVGWRLGTGRRRREEGEAGEEELPETKWA